LTDCNGYWKINNSILNEEEYKQIINNLINSYLNTKKTIDIRLLWDTLKIEIREITSVYCRNKAKSTRENLRNLEKDLEFEIKLKDGLQYDDENLDKDIDDLEHKISKIYENKAKVRSREKWVELGEKNNSYSLALEKKRQTKKSINKFKDENGDIICEQTELIKEIKRYYEQLYS
jgi:hypothetical protein